MYRRDRRKDQLLQENGYLVLRFLAGDLGKELDTVLDQILRTLSSRVNRSSAAVIPLAAVRRSESSRMGAPRIARAAIGIRARAEDRAVGARPRELEPRPSPH